jgi:hypothetical protein
MPSNAYYFGLLFVVFGGFLLLGRAQFAGASRVFGQFGLVVMFLGVAVGTFGLAGASASTDADE